MIQKVRKGKSALIDGPACVHLISGEISILGALIKAGEKIVVRKGKRVPLEPLGNAEVELILGTSASYSEIDGSAIPHSWKDSVNKILSLSKHTETLIIGGVDSGKTSLCTYLANKALDTKYKVAVVDGDLGQSDIGPPGTVGFCFIRTPFIDLFNLQPEDAVFIGVTSPSKMIDETLNALVTLKERALDMGAEFLIINTDGWVEGEDAVNYKLQLVKNVDPDVVLAIQKGNELSPIVNALEDVEVLVIDSPKNVKKRDRETRKVLRKSAYKKYLKEAKVRSYPLSWVKIEGILEISSRNFDKKVVMLKEGDERGLLVALEDAQGSFLGIGTIYSIDFKGGVIKIRTPVSEAAAKIRVGRIKLDREGNEIDVFY